MSYGGVRIHKRSRGITKNALFAGPGAELAPAECNQRSGALEDYAKYSAASVQPTASW